jgi:hypothetical protein
MELDWARAPSAAGNFNPALAPALAGDGQEADGAAGTRAVSQNRSGIVIKAQ